MSSKIIDSNVSSSDYVFDLSIFLQKTPICQRRVPISLMAYCFFIVFAFPILFLLSSEKNWIFERIHIRMEYLDFLRIGGFDGGNMVDLYIFLLSRDVGGIRWMGIFYIYYLFALLITFLDSIPLFEETFPISFF